MRKDVLHFFLFIFLLCTQNGFLIAQFEPALVEVSTQKAIFQGKVYYMHTIKPNQTLYSISKAYKVNTQDIATANPNTQLDVLKPEQVLRIPENPSPSVQTTVEPVAETKNYIYHTVVAQETVFSISKKYQVTPESIYLKNPSSKESIHIGQVLKIADPKVEVASESFNSPIDTNNSYLVKEGDTLYNIALKYNCSVSDFIEANPDLKSGLKPGMVLMLPGKSKHISHEDSLLLANLPKIKLYNFIQSDSIKKRTAINQIKIVVLLPLHTSEIVAFDTITVDSLKKSDPAARLKAQASGYLEFYEGLLLAIDSLKRIKKDVTLFTYDTRSDTNRIKEIIREMANIKPDMIIGPFKPQEIRIVSAFSAQNKIPLILPLSRSNGISKGNPYAIHLIPTSETELNESSTFLAQFQKKNTIVIYNSDSIGATSILQLKKSLLSKYESAPSANQFNYCELIVNDTLQRSISKALKKDTVNVVVLISNNEATVGNIISLLNIYAGRNKIILFGLPSWQKFDNLRIEQLHNLNTIIYSPFFIDYNKTATKNFVLNSRKYLKTEPYRTVSNGTGINLTFLGYETGLLFGTAFAEYGSNFINCLTALSFQMPESDYTFSFSNSGGFANSSINFIHYTNNYTIERPSKTIEITTNNK